jgi:cysteine synthase
MKAGNVLETIGNTPHIRINRLFGDRAEVWMKSERANPGGSIKDRIALAMIEDAERSGKLKPGGTIIEPTSGNTGIGLAMVAAVKGYKLILVMPESMSIERRRLMLAYGATFDLTPKEKGMSGAVARAQELIEQTPNSWMPQQFDNPANVEVHRRTTAQEILRDFGDQPLDAIITGVGTGGHITACAEVLKPVWPNLKVFAVEPALAAPDPGPRRQLRPEHSQHRYPRRNHRRRRERGEGNGAPRGSGGRAAHRNIVWSGPCRCCPEAARAWREATDPDV